MIYILIVAGIFFGELRIKNYIEKNKKLHQEESIMNGNIIISRHHNKGAMLNLLDKKPGFVKMLSGVFLGILTFILAVLLPKKGSALLKMALALILGGAASNVYDRIKRGFVVDYFSFKWLKKVIFNLADIAIFIGSFFVLLHSILKKKLVV